jgi:hypothetical protein
VSVLRQQRHATRVVTSVPPDGSRCRMRSKTSPAGGTETVVFPSSLQVFAAALAFLGDLLRGI